MKSIHAARGACWLAALLACGCGASSTPATSSAAKPVALENIGAALTEDDCRKAAEAYVGAISTGRLADLHGVTDWSGVCEQTVQGIEAPAKFRGDFVKMLPKVINEQFAQAVSGRVTEGGSYKLLRVRQKDGKWTAIARLLQAEGGANYHELTLLRRQDGIVRVADLYIYASGETIAETFRRIYLPGAAQENRGILDRLQGKENDFIKHFATFEKMTKAFREKRFGDTLAAYGELPPSLRRDKMILLMRIQAAQADLGEEYLSAIKAYETEFPDDPSLHLLLIDRHVLKGQHAKALACIDKLESQIGLDPHLDVLRANIHLTMGELAEAKKEIDRALAAEPDLVEVHWVRIAYAMAAKDFAAAAKHLENIEKEFSVVVDLEQLRTFPGYEDFEKSAEFRQWTSRKKE